MTQERIEKPAPQRSTEEELQQLAEDDAAVAAAQDKKVDLQDTDDLLDEIDGILEEQEVLTNFRQRGGE